MNINRIRSIAIVGGGTAGWMSAAYLAKIGFPDCKIRLIESDEIATIGVGEATIPQISSFNNFLGLDENEFLRNTMGTFKLGIEFVNWGQIGESYVHGFSPIGSELDHVSCHQYWLKLHQLGETSDLGKLCIGVVSARNAKFMRRRPDLITSPLAHIFNAFHFDAGLYAQYLRKYSETRGVLRTEGKVLQVVLRESDGFIESITLASGETVEAELFIDCTGIRAVLLGQALGVEYEDWSHWLPCNRAIAVPCESVSPLLPYTRSTARSAGWQWRIPLQHRIGNGHVYSSEFMGQDEATELLLDNLDGRQLAEPRYIPFVPGRRKRTWVKNCIAVGLSSGFFEPIESTNIHLIQSALQRMASLFPDTRFEASDIEEYNLQTQFEYEKIRDFIILHYKATRRSDSPFWNHCRNMSIPDTLQQKLNLYQSTGRVFRDGGELFSETSWIQVMTGQGIQPRSYDPLVDLRSLADIKKYLADVETIVKKCCDIMPTHEEYIAQYCAAATSLPSGRT